MSERVRLSDGSSFPRPSLESDECDDLAWVLTYGTPTRNDLLQAVSIISAYGYLLLNTTRERRDLVCREVRAALTPTTHEAAPVAETRTET